MSLLEVRDLTVAFQGPRGWNPVVDGVSFDVDAGAAVGLVGESGSGKTVAVMSILGLTAFQGARVLSGSVVLDGMELTSLGERQLARVRGTRVGMIFQQPTRSLDPAFTVGEQIAETIRRHERVTRREAWTRAVGLLDRVHISKPDERARLYPHQLSGGMCQRVMIAIALSCGPQLLIADEPTTALDVTVQARVLELLREVQADSGVGMIFVSHDLSVIASLCDSLLVMYAGEIVERASVGQLFRRPIHPYTAGLLASIPQPGQERRYRAIAGSVPSPGSIPDGCRFRPRCDHAVTGRCDAVHPDLEPTLEDGPDSERSVRCVRAAEITELCG